MMSEKENNFATPKKQSQQRTGKGKAVDLVSEKEECRAIGLKTGFETVICCFFETFFQ